MPAAPVIGAVASIGAGVAAGVTTLAGGLMVAGGVASLVGQATGNKTLQTIGGVASLAGGGIGLVQGITGAAGGMSAASEALSSSSGLAATAGFDAGMASAGLSGGLGSSIPAGTFGLGSAGVTGVGANVGAAGAGLFGGTFGGYGEAAAAPIAQDVAGSVVKNELGQAWDDITNAGAPSAPEPGSFAADHAARTAEQQNAFGGSPSQQVAAPVQPVDMPSPAQQAVQQPQQDVSLGNRQDFGQPPQQQPGLLGSQQPPAQNMQGFKTDPFAQGQGAVPGYSTIRNSPLQVGQNGVIADAATGQAVFNPATQGTWQGMKQGLSKIGQFIKNNKEAIDLMSGAIKGAYAAKGLSGSAAETAAMEELRKAQAEYYREQTAASQRSNANSNNITGLNIGMAPNPGATPFYPGGTQPARMPQSPTPYPPTATPMPPAQPMQTVQPRTPMRPGLLSSR